MPVAEPRYLDGRPVLVSRVVKTRGALPLEVEVLTGNGADGADEGDVGEHVNVVRVGSTKNLHPRCLACQYECGKRRKKKNQEYHFLPITKYTHVH